MFYVGQKVVCVKAAGMEDHLKDGETYIIERGTYHIRNSSFVRLVGIGDAVKGPPYHSGGFYTWRFRPLVERKNEAGMEMLRKLLDPANHKHLEGV